MSNNIAVVGATGNVGRNVLKVLAERSFPADNIYALASKNSVGKEVSYGENESLVVDSVENFDFSKVNIALFSAGSKVSAKYIPIASKNNCISIDNTPHFRMDPDVPLVVPEVNPEDLKTNSFKNKHIIANPNCVVVPIAVAMKPLDDLFGIKRMVISTYQSVSGAGKEAMDELYEQTRGVYTYKSPEPKKFKKQIAFNAIPQIDEFDDNGFTKEENKIREEIKKILNDHIEVVPTCVRVPVFIGHGISLTVEFEDDVNLAKAIEAMQNSEGLVISDLNDPFEYKTQVDVSGEGPVFVSRIRKDPSRSNVLCMWIVSDNTLKGAALNAVQIAEMLA